MKVAENYSFPSSSSRSPVTHCEVRSCGLYTREGKPFCPDHVDMNSYAMRVLRSIERRSAEDLAVSLGKTPVSKCNINGITARAILQNLSENGPRTKIRLCRDLAVDISVVEGYAKALIKRKLVVAGKTGRGIATLVLVKPL
jgi:hypothetical protein